MSDVKNLVNKILEGADIRSTLFEDADGEMCAEKAASLLGDFNGKKNISFMLYPAKPDVLNLKVVATPRRDSVVLRGGLYLVPPKDYKKEKLTYWVLPLLQLLSSVASKISPCHYYVHPGDVDLDIWKIPETDASKDYWENFKKRLKKGVSITDNSQVIFDPKLKADCVESCIFLKFDSAADIATYGNKRGVTYKAFFEPTLTLDDFDAAQRYLASDKMTTYLKDDFNAAGFDPAVIKSIMWILDTVDSGDIVLKTTRVLSNDELDCVSDFCAGQNTDGIGEGLDDFHDYTSDTEDGSLESDCYLLPADKFDFDWEKK